MDNKENHIKTDNHPTIKLFDLDISIKEARQILELTRKISEEVQKNCKEK